MLNKIKLFWHFFWSLHHQSVMNIVCLTSNNYHFVDFLSHGWALLSIIWQMNSEYPLGTFHPWQSEGLMAVQREEKGSGIDIHEFTIFQILYPKTHHGQIQMGEETEYIIHNKFCQSSKTKDCLRKKPKASNSGGRFWIISLVDMTPSREWHFISSFFSQCFAVLIQSCLSLCDPMDCNLPGSSVHGIFQARILEWVAISFSRGPSQPKDQTYISCSLTLAGRFFTSEPSEKPLESVTGWK